MLGSIRLREPSRRVCSEPSLTVLSVGFVLQITELLKDVERLKQALNGLSQLTYTAGIPSKRHSQQVELLQSQVRTLQQQLAVSAPTRCCVTCGSTA